ncbi:ABSCISIC ACID-INSENSITIVE 5-like protein 4 [Rhododendron vialii]|uniref:ABSCISIC ACID-INSENSITIVE 5-like protein 4 n=1 Tax=Rhododendron vialii TaxID=182163 RepID=UPI00266001B1|nr:ABSCISIC ACID-INSENSITIVE 5-like protein 4 [Rhododendron vialii]
MGQGSNIPVLANLTFDEVHSQLGNSNKPLNCMNLDELVKNFLSPDEEYQSIKNLASSFSYSSTSSSSSLVFRGNFNLNGTHSRKTGDEVWGEIIHDESVLNPQLLRAVAPTVVVAAQQEDWFKLPMQSVDLNFQVGIENRPLESPMPIVPRFSLDSQVGFLNKCSFKDEKMEKTIERRQERMMKNRESAARSRARKQAHTNQLEHMVSLLRRTNNWLKKKKEINKLLSSHSTSKPRFQLRRTSSSLF